MTKGLKFSLARQDADSRYCEPVAGDYANHSEKLRNYIWFQVASLAMGASSSFSHNAL